MKVGFIGLGSMGGKQAHELSKSDHQLTVYDVFPEALQKFEGRAVLANSIADVGVDADAVGVCVRDDVQVMECVDALLPVMKEGAVLMIHSTVRPATMVGIAGRAAEGGIKVLDASVTRTEMVEDAPFVFCMLGGDEADVALVQSVLDCYSTDTMHIGPTGTAMALKISNNLISWSGILCALEAVNIAESAGVPLDKLMTIMKRNGVLTPPAEGFIGLRSKHGEEEIMAFMNSQAHIGEKDMQLSMEMADKNSVGSNISTFFNKIIVENLNNTYK